MNLLEGASSAFGADPSRPAVIEDARSWSWTEFVAEVERIADEIGRDRGEGPIEISVPSGTRFLTRFLAASLLGRPACTLHSDWSAPELEAALAAVRGGELRATEPLTEDNPFFYIGFTSGTSGRPKPFARRQRSWTSSFDAAGELFSVESGDTFFLPGSLQHSHFLFGAVFGLDRGAAVRLFGRFDAGRLAEELESARRAVLYLVPTMLVDLEAIGSDPFTGVHSVVISGAKMESHHWQIIRRLFPEAAVGEIYGASELSFVSVNTTGELPDDPGYVGRPFPGVEIEIRPLDGADDDGQGVVYVRSPYLFEGYLDESGVHTLAGPDGFMTVGDIGTLRPQGLSLSGRASNLLITGGKNVHPEEVEAQLNSHPAVSESIVAGVPHPRWGEELVTFISASAGDAGLEVEELKGFLRERVASYKIPKRWFVVENIPRTRAGKTDRGLDRLFADATELGITPREPSE